MTIAAFVPDLMDRSRFSGCRLLSSLEELRAATESLVVVDLSRPGVLDSLPDTKVVGFAPHVDDALLAQANERGVEALPRSVFFRRLPDLLAGEPEG